MGKVIVNLSIFWWRRLRYQALYQWSNHFISLFQIFQLKGRLGHSL